MERTFFAQSSIAKTISFLSPYFWHHCTKRSLQKQAFEKSWAKTFCFCFKLVVLQWLTFVISLEKQQLSHWFGSKSIYFNDPKPFLICGGTLIVFSKFGGTHQLKMSVKVYSG